MSLKNVLDVTIKVCGWRGGSIGPDDVVVECNTLTAAQGANIPIIRCDNYIATPKVIGESVATKEYHSMRNQSLSHNSSITA